MARTRRKRWWAWDQLVVQATGEDPAEVLEEELRAYRRHLLVTLREARDQLGRWPGGPERDTATADDAARTYVRQSRSWKAACWEADQLGTERQ